MSGREEHAGRCVGEYGDDKIIVVSRRVVRFILSNSESQNTIFGKGKLQSVAKDYATQENFDRIPFNVLFQEVNRILEDVYGYRLTGLPPRIGVNNRAVNMGMSQNIIHDDNKDQSDSKASRFILLNIMRGVPKLDETRLDRSRSLYRDILRDENYLRENVSNSATLRNVLNTHQDLVFKGLLTVVVCIIIFSKNNILQQELFNHLKSYGIPTDGSAIPILKWNIDEFVKTLDKREYIVRMEQNSGVEGIVISYRIGRRIQKEFTFDALVEMMRQVFELDASEIPRLQEDIKRNIGDSYASSEKRSSFQ